MEITLNIHGIKSVRISERKYSNESDVYWHKLIFTKRDGRTEEITLFPAIQDEGIKFINDNDNKLVDPKGFYCPTDGGAL